MAKLARLINTPYSVRYEGKTYEWGGAKGGIITTKEVPEEVLNYLLGSTSVFQKGRLKIVEDDSQETKEAIENIPDKEGYEANTLSEKEIQDILKGNINKMKSELNKITSQSTKNFVLQIAKDIKIDSASKQTFIKEWLGLNSTVEEIFSEE